MLDEWREIKANGEPRKPEERSFGPLPVMAQLELLMLLLIRP